MTKQPTAAVLLIGNELLSGRTQDKNVSFIAQKLVEKGVSLLEARVIPDDEAEIGRVVNELRVKYDYVFTTGGIGPTHDDITSGSIAKAFGVSLIRHPEAVKRLESHYKGRLETLNEMRLRMADVPQGASLIDNPVSGAPGFKIENVYVMAGVPSIMQAMFDNILVSLTGGDTKKSITVSTDVPEGDLAQELQEIQQQHQAVDIGSYPFIRNGRLGTSLVARGFDEQELQVIAVKLTELAQKYNGTVFQQEGSTW